MSDAWTDREQAANFVAGVKLGVERWADIRDYESVYGPSDGFVYFIGIGGPYLTHVKIGYTKKDPLRRMADLQTGCPFEMIMLGYVFGVIDRERELHDVLRDYRCCGEWFEYSEYVASTVRNQLEAEAI